MYSTSAQTYVGGRHEEFPTLRNVDVHVCLGLPILYLYTTGCTTLTLHNMFWIGPLLQVGCVYIARLPCHWRVHTDTPTPDGMVLTIYASCFCKCVCVCVSVRTPPNEVYVYIIYILSTAHQMHSTCSCCNPVILSFKSIMWTLALRCICLCACVFSLAITVDVMLTPEEYMEQ